MKIRLNPRTRKNGFLAFLLIVVASGHCFSQDYADEIIFHANGSAFSPVITVDGEAEILWTFHDNTTSASASPTKEYGSESPRTNRLKVTPWNAIRGINIGYNAGDGGTYDIAFVDDQRVSEVEHLDLTAPYLELWCSSYNLLDTLIFDDFVNLEKIECYLSTTVRHVSLRNTPKLKRLCLEDNDLKTLDLSGCTGLEDLRGALNDYKDITFSNSTDEVWHICIRENHAIENASMFAHMENFPAISEFFIWNTHQSGTFETHATTAGSISFLAWENDYDRLDLSGAFQNESGWAEVNFSSNDLTSVNIAGCDQIGSLILNANALSADSVDQVLRQLDESGRNNGTVELLGNSIPTSTGFGYKANLEAKGWTVKVETVNITFTDGSGFMPSVTKGGTDQILGRFQLSGEMTGASLTSASIRLNGARTGFSNFKLWASSDASFGSDSPLGSAVAADPGDGNTISYSGFSSDIGTSGVYYFLTSDVSSDATGSVQGIVAQNGSLTMLAGTLSGTIANAPLSNDDDPLPVGLVSFSAATDGYSVTLTWIAQSEVNHLGYILERLNGNGVWVRIASYETHEELQARGNASSASEYGFIDTDIESGKEYSYRLSDVSNAAEMTLHAPISIRVDVGAYHSPKTTGMDNAYPNPFNPETFIGYHLSKDSQVAISVFDMLGRPIKRLFNGYQRAGSYQVYWNGTDEFELRKPSGSYFIRMETGETRRIRKVMLIQ